MNAPEIAIDFGTTRTKVAHFDPKTGRSELIELGRENPRFIPSVFYVGTEGDDGGEILVGDDARQRLLDDPMGIVFGLKLDIDNPRKITVGTGRPRLRRSELLTRLFALIREVCSVQHFHTEVTRCAITIPVVFEEPKRVAIREAARAAGFGEIRLLEEPVAAALAWLAEKPEHLPDHIVICDVGGGTTDFALVHRVGERFQPDPKVAPYGFPAGGNALDEDIWREFKSGSNGNVDSSKQNFYLDEIRKAKERLDSLRSDTVTLGGAERVALSTDAFKVCCSNFVEDIGEQLDGFLGKCRTEAGIENPAVLLVGGSSKLPGLKERIENTGSKVYQWLKSEWAPVLGAALPRDFRLGANGAGVVSQTSEDIKYREAVRMVWLDRKIDDSEFNNLAFYAKELGLTPETTMQIERDVMGQTKEEAYHARTAEVYASILEDTTKLISAGKGREAFDNAEKALIETGSDDALDAWMNAMETLSSAERISGSAAEIAKAVAESRPDVSTFVRVFAHVTAEAKEVDTKKLLDWLEPLGDSVHSYSHALAVLFYWGQIGQEKSEQAKLVTAFARDLRPSSATLDFLELGQKAVAEDLRVLLDVVRKIRKHSQSPAALMLDYCFDLKARQAGISETSDFSEFPEFSEVLISESRRDEIVRRLRHIAPDSFSQRITSAFHALYGRRLNEFMSISEELLKSSFCEPEFGAILWEFRSSAHMGDEPPNYKEAAACLEKALSLERHGGDKEGGYEVQLSELLVEWADSLFPSDPHEARRITNRAIKVCEGAIVKQKDSAKLRNQKAYSMLRAYGFSDPPMKKLALEGYTQSLENLKTSAEDELAKMLHFGFCVITEAPDKLFCVAPFIPQAVIDGAFQNYLGRYLEDDEQLFFLCDVAFVNSGSVGAAVTSRQIVANTRFFGTTNISNWQSKSVNWNKDERKLKVGGVEVPYGNEIGEFLYKILTRYQSDLKKAEMTPASTATTANPTASFGKSSTLPPPLPQWNPPAASSPGDLPSRKGGLCPKCGKPFGEGATRCWNGGCNYVR